MKKTLLVLLVLCCALALALAEEADTQDAAIVEEGRVDSDIAELLEDVAEPEDTLLEAEADREAYGKDGARGVIVRNRHIAAMLRGVFPDEAEAYAVPGQTFLLFVIIRLE